MQSLYLGFNWITMQVHLQVLMDIYYWRHWWGNISERPWWKWEHSQPLKSNELSLPVKEPSWPLLEQHCILHIDSFPHHWPVLFKNTETIEGRTNEPSQVGWEPKDPSIKCSVSSCIAIWSPPQKKTYL